MAGNKFATTLHRNTHKITLILVYAILEWILIYLLLLNSLFSYLIMKFANYFGLKPPCLFCSRIDHVLDSKTKSYTDLICENHCNEISSLSYCSKHRKLTTDRCCEVEEDDDFDIKDERNRVLDEDKHNRILCDDVNEKLKKIEDFITERDLDFCVEGMDLVLQSPKVSELQDSSLDMINLKPEDCFDFGTDRFIPVELIDSTTLKTQEPREIENVKERDWEGILSTELGNEKAEEKAEEMGILLVEKMAQIIAMVESMDMSKDPNLDSVEESDVNCVSQGSKSLYGDEGNDVELVMVALDDSAQHSEVKEETESESLTENEMSDEELADNHAQLDSEQIVSLPCSIPADAFVATNDQQADEHSKQPKDIDSKMSMDETKFMNLIEKELPIQLNNHTEDEEKISSQPCAQALTNECNGEDTDSDTLVAKKVQASEHSELKDDDDTKSMSSIEKEMPVPVNNLAEEQLSSLPCSEENHFDTDAFTAENDQGSEHTEEVNNMDDRSPLVERIEQPLTTRQLSIATLECDEIEEEKGPETPTFVNGLHNLHMKFLDLERKESATEASGDGSVIVEAENGGDGNMTIEKLKSALKAEHKALSALYAELEEERSASAIAANQTMAMITRLQEEKSAMQMEALQYQRMMDEQSEYDQEALQLLNELMVKREREKQEMEKELEIYRKKVLLYENEKKMMRRKSNSGRSGTSSASGNATDSEELSVDLNHENTDEFNFYAHQDSPNNRVLNLDDAGLESSKQLSTLDESLADFEEERQSILQQLKALEEKLFTLEDDEHEEGEQLFEDTTKANEHLSEANGTESNKNHDESNEEEIVNGHLNDYKKHYGEKTHGGAKAKKLLPLFDEAIDVENEDEFTNDEHEAGSYAVFSPNSSMSKFTSDEKKLALVEEVDHVYERLHALEADREFLKHCLTSLKKGGKGMDLLQEILQHLRDLRNVDLHVRNMSDASLNQSFSH
ncbi:hypothetical protein C5167_005547 [Papaver somniferum]|uniref:GTD-binding domain-containing protein n=1 Tax=Papaver somniferum TaxID=3469 RepID=A0A4Y7JDX7_PAPSO|nr:myosin-binding protein 3-like [Papaver somniferum]RZC58252.1 hypothetical protein C5167_005547 [Papaver somniferum]